MLCPFGRRILVLLGAVGVGRRTLKSMLLRSSPQHFATVIVMRSEMYKNIMQSIDISLILLQVRRYKWLNFFLVTSRAQRSGEQEGREYNFARKEDLLQKIRDGDMIEWGELDNQIYALSYLYNGEFMPFVVHIVPPQLEEFLQLENLRQTKRPVDQLSKVKRCSRHVAIRHPMGSGELDVLICSLCIAILLYSI
uniref:Guanylate kinase-like domain-containing protein n=1 Tax=Heterorhabditis bacteriophora TaxID=37862 RepID=A0A1I7WFZ4_HETBA